MQIAQHEETTVRMPKLTPEEREARARRKALAVARRAAVKARRQRAVAELQRLADRVEAKAARAAPRLARAREAEPARVAKLAKQLRATLEDAPAASTGTGKRFRGDRRRQDLMKVADAPPAAAYTGETGWPSEDFAEDMRRRVAMDQAARLARMKPTQWTPDAVWGRLVEAYGNLALMPMRTRPQAYGNGMPEIVRSLADLIGAGLVHAGSIGESMGRVAPSMTLDEIQRMDAALAWPGRYVAPRNPRAANLLARAAAWSALDLSEATQARRFGVSLKGFRRVRGVGLVLIADGLNAAGVAVE